VQFLVSLLCIIAGFTFLVPKTNGLNVQALDGTVGLGIPLQSNITNPLSPVVFQVIKPDGTVLYISGQTDEVGIAKKDLAEFPYVLSMELGMSYQVGKLPYAVLIDEKGVVRAKGLTNSREHLESLFEAKDLGVASIQEFMSNKAQSEEQDVA